MIIFVSKFTPFFLKRSLGETTKTCDVLLVKGGWTRDKVVAEIVKQGVPCFQGSCSEVYLEKAFDGTGFRPKKRLKNAKELGETSIMFLVHPTLTNAEIEKTCEVIDTVLNKASI